LPQHRRLDPESDPIQHFRASRQTLPRAWGAERQASIQAAVEVAAAAIGDVHGKAERLAERLNAVGHFD
jgi:hypothetical protein